MIARAAQLNTSSSQWPTYHWSCSYTEYKYPQPFPPAPFCFLPLSQNNSRVRPSSSILLQRAPPLSILGLHRHHQQEHRVLSRYPLC